MLAKGLLRRKVSKSDTIDAIVEGAVQVFSRHGFEAGALRDIAVRAGVPLSTIHRYFPSKQQLYLEVTRRILEQVSADRERLLGAALSVDDSRPRLESVLHALAYPIVARAHCADSLPMVQVLRNAAPTHLRTSIMRHHPGHWLKTIMRECSSLKINHAIWAYSFVEGAMYSWQMLDHAYDHALRSEEKLSAEEVSEALEIFCAAGIRALENRDRSLKCRVENLKQIQNGQVSENRT
jgi:AcrR family transcriptional regulator